MLRENVPRVLYIAAHPDDEDTRLIAWLSRGGYADVAYLSLTRGEGGQNLIGDELGEALGVLRTQELLAARRIDGALQYFTRAYEFGFSKTADETFSHWPRDSILDDVVKVVRAFRPHVIVTTFSGTPRDGHGQHQASAILAREAYERAADTVRFPVRYFGAPWTPLKLYRLARFAGAQGTIRMNVGEFDPIAGRSYEEIASESRSRHKSQGYRPTARLGVVWDELRREESRVNAATPATEEHSIFDGIGGISANPDRALPEDVDLRRPESTLPIIARYRPRDDLERARYDRAAALAAGIAFEALVEREFVARGDSARVSYTVYNRGRVPLRLAGGGDGTSSAWIAPDSVVAWKAYFKGERITEAWWLATPRRGDLFTQPIDERSEQERELLSERWAHAAVEVQGLRELVNVAAPLTYRISEPPFGDMIRVVTVAPGLTLTPDSRAGVVKAATPITRDMNVTVRSTFAADRDVIIRLDLPRGLAATPTVESLRIPAGGTRTVTFQLRGTLDAGEHTVRIRGESGGETFARAVQPIEYEHILPQRIYAPAELRLSAVPVHIPEGLSIAYVPGVADVAPDVLRQLGIAVTVVPVSALLRTDLSRFPVVVVGPRAYEATPELLQHNQRLFDYASRGGRLVVQYGQYLMDRPGILPYPIKFVQPNRERVTDENAPVTITDSGAVELNYPNRISAADFEGWVQERSLFMPREIDPRYHTILAMNDPGDPSEQGAILIAPLGRGTYVYTTLAFFRQLRAGVPGATRLFVNLISPPAP